MLHLGLVLIWLMSEKCDDDRSWLELWSHHEDQTTSLAAQLLRIRLQITCHRRSSTNRSITASLKKPYKHLFWGNHRNLKKKKKIQRPTAVADFAWFAQWYLRYATADSDPQCRRSGDGNVVNYRLLITLAVHSLSHFHLCRLNCGATVNDTVSCEICAVPRHCCAKDL